MNKFISFTSIISMVLGLAMLTGGVWGIAFTYKSVVRENITTSSDASISEIPVRGPFTLKAQSDVIRHHTLDSTEGKTYSEMSRDEDRSIWITATTLMNALNLGILAYAFFALSIALGLFLILSGLVFRRLNKES